MKVVRKLSTRHCGFSRKEIGDHIGISSGSGLTKILNNLEASDFIQGYKPIDAEKGEKLYRLIDPFCHFLIRFVEKRASSDESFWQNNQNLPEINTWRGIAFEDICINHIKQIKSALGILGVASEESEFILRGDSSHDGTQMDLIIERADRVVNLCEMKFYNGEFEIDKSYDLVLRQRITRLYEHIGKRQSIHLTFITSFGVKPNMYSGIVQSSITLDDLFRA